MDKNQSSGTLSENSASHIFAGLSTSDINPQNITSILHMVSTRYLEAFLTLSLGEGGDTILHHLRHIQFYISKIFFESLNNL